MENEKDSATKQEERDPSPENEKDSVSEEQQMTQSTSSSLDIRDWEVIYPDNIGFKRNVLSDSTDYLLDSLHRSPSGLFVHDNLAQHSRVEDLSHPSHHNDSNSSSDIDVLDEHPADSQSNLSIQSLESSVSPSEISGTISVSEEREEDTLTPSEETPEREEEPPQEPRTPRNQNERSFLETAMAVVRLAIDAFNAFNGDRMSAREYFVIGFVVSVILVLPCTHIALHKANFQEKKIEEMEGHVSKLLSENERLKTKVLAKIESGKLFGDLDEEVKELKSENYKLHKAMQTVIQQLEQQTHTIKKGLEMKENVHKDPYKKEIAKLKEQINLLRFDNEELQKQLVRIRYGKHAANRVKAEPETKVEDINIADKLNELKKKEDTFEDIKERREEISELRRKLSQEVEKLKVWKESLEEFVHEIENPHNGKEKHFEREKLGKKEHKHEKAGFKQENSESENIKNKKNRKYYNNWSWKNIKKNFKGTLENFPEMFSKYVVIDKEKVDGVLDTISHYYKKAQDKTKKILEKYSVDEKTQNVKDDIWTLMGEMKNKWVDMKNQFMEAHFGGKPKDKEDSSDQSNDQIKNMVILEPEVASEQAIEPEIKDTTEISQSWVTEEADVTEKSDDLEESMQSVKEVNQLLKEAQRRFSQQSSNINSWMFERAQHRADLRESDDSEEDSGLNWFLKRSKLWTLTPNVVEEEE